MDHGTVRELFFKSSEKGKVVSDDKFVPAFLAQASLVSRRKSMALLFSNEGLHCFEFAPGAPAIGDVL